MAARQSGGFRVVVAILFLCVLGGLYLNASSLIGADALIHDGKQEPESVSKSGHVTSVIGLLPGEVRNF